MSVDATLHALSGTVEAGADTGGQTVRIWFKDAREPGDVQVVAFLDSVRGLLAAVLGVALDLCALDPADMTAVADGLTAARVELDRLADEGTVTS